MGLVNATTWGYPSGNPRVHITTFAHIVGAGFRRYSTYRQATVAGAFTNIVFGFLRCYVFLAVSAGAGAGLAAGYTSEQLVTFVWAGQGVLAVVLLGYWSELGDRIRTGEVTADLLRPVHPVVVYLATDLGRAGHAALTRFIPPMVAGLIFFDCYLPHRWHTVPLFLGSTALALVLCFGCRYLVNTSAYWLLDLRGPMVLWIVSVAAAGGLLFPVRFLPDWLAVALWIGTPFPSVFQTPLDVLVEADPTPRQCALVALQLLWAGLILAACAAVQRRAERRLVIQGG